MTTSKWSVGKSQIKLDGTPFFVKGVAYSPIPAGVGVWDPQIGDWFYSVDGQPKVWNQIFERDLPKMQNELGVNVLKTYFFWPWSPPTDMSTWKTVVQNPPRNHTPFLDACRQHGVYVLIGVAIDVGSVFDNADASLAKDYQDFYSAVVDKLTELYGKHEAVMGFVIGNEMNDPTRCQRQDFWDLNAKWADTAKQNAPDKLVLQAFQNDPSLFTYEIKYKNQQLDPLPKPWKTVPEVYSAHYDLWGLNVFNGNSFDPFWSRFQQQIIDAGYAQPLLMTEYGVPAGTNDPRDKTGAQGAKAVELPNDAKDAADDLEQLWADLVKHKDICSGGTYFEYCDEWWKGNADPSGSAQEQVCQHTYGSNSQGGAFPGGWWEPAWWGLYSIAPNGRSCTDGPWDGAQNKPYPPDELEARAAVAVMKKLAVPKLDPSR